MFISILFYTFGLLCIANYLLLYLDIPKYISKSHPTAEDTRESIACVIEPSKPKERAVFGRSSGATVYGYPSKGGIYILECCDGIELDFLGLDRFTPSSRSEDTAEEDAHCTNMRKLGANWWSSEWAYLEQHYLDPTGPNPLEAVTIVGWPKDGGVWVLRSTYKEGISKGVGRVKNAFSMEERCRVIENLGGVFYANPKECPDLDLLIAVMMVRLQSRISYRNSSTNREVTGTTHRGINTRGSRGITTRKKWALKSPIKQDLRERLKSTLLNLHS